MSDLSMEVGELKGAVKALSQEVLLLRQTITPIEALKNKILGVSGVISALTSTIVLLGIQIWKDLHK